MAGDHRELNRPWVELTHFSFPRKRQIQPSTVFGVSSYMAVDVIASGCDLSDCLAKSVRRFYAGLVKGRCRRRQFHESVQVSLNGELA